MDLKSKDFAGFRAPYRKTDGKQVDKGQEEEGARTLSEPEKRAESARGWGKGIDAEKRYFETLQSLKEAYGSGEQNVISGEGEGESFEARRAEEGDEFQTGESGEEGDEAELPSFEESDDRWMMDNDYSHGAHADSTQISREDVAKRRITAGTVSGYKHKEELQATLERKAALKFIREKREDVEMRARVLREAEEKVSITQGHLEEIDSKVEQLKYGPFL